MPRVAITTPGRPRLSGALGGSNVCGEQRGKSRGLATRHSTLGTDPVHTRVPPGGREAGLIACCVAIVD